MSSDGAVRLVWADGEYRFRLAIGQLRELQAKCEAGPQEVYGRLNDGTWRVDDLRETIRLGLIGGGDVDPLRALTLVGIYVDGRPLLESRPVAISILVAALVGVPEDPVGKRTGGEGGGSASPPSTASARRSAGRRGRSTI